MVSSRQLFEDPQRKATAETIAHLVRKRYPPEEYAVFYEVGDGTGFHVKRHADAIAVSLWPSRGLEVEGFEFKVSRTDWLKELRDPSKAESIARFCDRWWLVVGNDKVLQPGELPANWGLMTIECSKGEQHLKVASPAGKLQPVPLDRLFMAAVCRAAQKQSATLTAIARAVSEAKAKWERDHQEREELQRRHRSDKLIELQNVVAEFEKASGVRLSHYSFDAGKIGEAVRVLMGGRASVAEHLDNSVRALEIALQDVRTIAALPALRNPVVVTPSPPAEPIPEQSSP